MSSFFRRRSRRRHGQPAWTWFRQLVFASARLRAEATADLRRLTLDRGRPLVVRPVAPGLTVSVVSLAWLGSRPAAGLEALACRHLSRDERDRWMALSSPKRRLEWFAGRLAVKHAVAVHVGRRERRVPRTRDVRIDAIRSGVRAGQPVLVAPRPQTPIAVTVSHSGAFAVAACAPGAVGIDVERHREYPPPLSRLLSAAVGPHGGLDPDVDRLANMPPPLRWACLEAVLKHVGLGLRVSPGAVRLDRWTAGGWFGWTAGEQLRSAVPAAEGRNWCWARDLAGHSLAVVWR